MEWVRKGGYIDFTSGEAATAAALLAYIAAGDIDMSQICCSTDAYGSQPSFDAAGKLIGYSTTSPGNSLLLLRQLVLDSGVPMSTALPLFTCNPADAVGLSKGRARVGYDADLLVLDSSSLALQYVISRGRVLKTPQWTATGMFEQCYCANQI
jgi:beta-aspartyl-dipeptidase (metallo-type)